MKLMFHGLSLFITITMLGFSWGQQGQFGYDFTISGDGTYIWYIEERAVVKNEKLYAGYVTTDGYSGISVIDLASGGNIGEDVHVSSWQQSDDHNNGAILPMANGKMMILYTLHDARRTQYFRVSHVDEPETLADWGPERSYSIPGGTATYNNAYQLSAENGRIYNFFRVGARDPHYITFDANGNVDGTVNRLIINEGSWVHRAYSKYVSNGVDQIDYFFTDGHPHAKSTSLFHMYYKSGSFYQTDGNLVGTIAQAPFTVDQGTSVYAQGEDGTNSNPWNHEVQYDQNGKPVLLYSHQADQHTLDYYIAYWNDISKKWEKHWVADAGEALIQGPMIGPDGVTQYGGTQYDYAGGIALSPYDAKTLFISTDVNPIDSQPTAKYEIYQATIGADGKSFSWKAITQNSKESNYRPYVPKGVTNKENEVVIWFTGRYDQFTAGTRTLSTGEEYHFQGYDTRVVGRYIHREHKNVSDQDYAIDINHRNAVSENNFTGLNGTLGSNVTIDGATFTIIGSAGSRDRNQSTDINRDFAFTDGNNLFVGVELSGLPAGIYAVNSWHVDLSMTGTVSLSIQEKGNPGQSKSLVSSHSLSNGNPAAYSIEIKNGVDYELIAMEEGTDNRTRFNGLTLKRSGTLSIHETPEDFNWFTQIKILPGSNTISISNFGSQSIEVIPMDVNGRKVKYWENRSGNEIFLEGLAPGIHLLCFFAPKNSKVKKVIVP